MSTDAKKHAPYKVKKGDTVGKIAKQHGLTADALREYHNNNTEDLNNMIGRPKRGKWFIKIGQILLIPLKTTEEIAEAQAVAEVAEKQQPAKAPPPPEETPDKNTTHYGFLVSEKGTCACDMGFPDPQKEAKFEITSHSKHFINGEKLVATTKDLPLPFKEKQQTFGKCKQQPAGNDYLPCVPNITQWNGAYEKITYTNKGNALLWHSNNQKGSIAKCSFGGKISITRHGQEEKIGEHHEETADGDALHAVAPWYKKEKKEEAPKVKYIKLTTDEKSLKSATKAKEGVIQKNLRPGAVVKFEVAQYHNPRKAVKNWVNWRIYNNHNYQEYTQDHIYAGPTFEETFETEGKYRILAYGNFNNPEDNFCAFDIEIGPNKPVDIMGFEEKGEEEKKRNLLNRLAAYTFKVKTFTGDWQPQDGELKWVIEHESGTVEELTIDTGTTIKHIFKTEGNYTFKVYHNQATEPALTETAQVSRNWVNAIRSDRKKVAVGDAVNFVVDKYRLVNTNIMDPRSVKWSVKKPDGTIYQTKQTGNQICLSFDTLGNWNVEAHMEKQPNFKGGDNILIQVLKNRIKRVGLSNQPKLGKETTFKITEFILGTPPTHESSTIKWRLNGIEQKNQSGGLEFTHRFMQLGEYFLSCSYNGFTQEPINICITQIEVKDIYWGNSNGRKLKKTGWQQEVYLFMKLNEVLKDEKLKLSITDEDINGDTLVHQATVAVNSQGYIQHRFMLNQEIKDQISRRDRYFGVLGVLTPKLEPLTLKAQLTHDTPTLEVSNKRELQRINIGNLRGYKRHTLVDHDEVSYVNIQTRGYKGECITLKLYEDIWGFDKSEPEMSFDETVAPDGLLSYKIDWSQIEKKEGKRRTFYFKLFDKDKNLLYKPYGDLSFPITKKKDPYGHVNLLAGSNLKFDESTPGMALVAIEDLENGSCKGKFCIGMGTEGKLIQEVNIRLAGFGGNVPTKKFTPRTLKMINQFQKDYMGIEPTGKICGDTLKAIDDFEKKYPINFEEIKCKCGKCSGFGKERNKDEYQKSSIQEKHRKYEYPGVHRSLVCGYRASLFYVEKESLLNYKTKHVESGYRCHDHSIYINTGTTNHCGKALDIHYNYLHTGKRTKDVSDMNKIRKKIFMAFLGAGQDWNSGKNKFYLESWASTWVHVDVREFSQEYLTKEYFVKNNSGLNGKNIVELAKNEGYSNTCKCVGSYAYQKNASASNKCQTKFEKISPIILEHEGGYVNHPDDKGGPTNKGITLATWEKYAKDDLGVEPTLDNLKVITDEQASKIYRKHYWEPKGFCEVENDKIGLMVYDWTITSGGAGKQIQKLLVDDFNATITVDGKIGAKTIKALNNVKNQDNLLKRIGEIRKKYYTDLTYTNGVKNSQDVFLNGWHNRVDKCLNANI